MKNIGHLMGNILPGHPRKMTVVGPSRNSTRKIGRAVRRNEVGCDEVAARLFAQYVPKGVIAGGLIHG